MLSLWIFDTSWGFGGSQGANNRYPMFAEYEWIRFYKLDSDTTYPCAALDASCMQSGDEDRSGNNPCDGLAAAALGHPCGATCPY